MAIHTILRISGLLLWLFAAMQILPMVTALWFQDNTAMIFVLIGSIALLAGVICWWPTRHISITLKRRDGFFLVVFFWCGLSALSALPLLLTVPLLSVPDAFFEAVSGLTTTGATVLTGLDKLPPAVLLFRQQLQWLGGMGIIVLAVAVAPFLGIGGMQLYRAEIPGPSKENKLTPRIAQTAKALWYIYFGLTVTCALSYYLAGMSWFDAIGHSFSTVSLGGFSTHDSSFGYFDNAAIEIVAVVFMVIAGMNFALHFRAFHKQSLSHYVVDAEWRFFMYALISVAALAAFYLSLTVFEHNGAAAIRYGVFQTVSMFTTTGFVTTDLTMWPLFIVVILLLASCVGGCAGSTGGGMKAVRVMLCIQHGFRELFQTLHPNAVTRPAVKGYAVTQEIMSSIWGFVALYMMTAIVVILSLMLLGLDGITAFSATLATFNNLGQAAGDVSVNYSALLPAAKWLLSATMILGRLELVALFVLFSRHYWR